MLRPAAARLGLAVREELDPAPVGVGRPERAVVLVGRDAGGGEVLTGIVERAPSVQLEGDVVEPGGSTPSTSSSE